MGLFYLEVVHRKFSSRGSVGIFSFRFVIGLWDSPPIHPPLPRTISSLTPFNIHMHSHHPRTPHLAATYLTVKPRLISFHTHIKRWHTVPKDRLPMSSSSSCTLSRTSSMSGFGEESADETTQLLPKQAKTEQENSSRIFRLWQVGALIGRHGSFPPCWHILI